MKLWEVIVIAVGLSMDAFAVSICKGLASGKATGRQALSAALWFGGFQALMPAIGYLLGMAFKDYITAVDHWIAFILLGWIGINMIREAFGDEPVVPDFSWKAMLPLAVATSIDALTVGVTLAFLNINIWITVTAIGITTFIFSYVGTMIGSKVGSIYGSKAKLAGGIILIILGCKILLEHLGII